MTRHYGILTTLLLSLPLFASCTDRERSNPFDPNNPDTGGEPYLFEAVADDQRAHLSWSDQSLTDLQGFEVVRNVLDGSPGDTARYRFGTERTSFLDKDLTNGSTYLYRLGFLFTGNTSWANSDTVTPGSAVPWVLDGYAGILIRLSPDCRDRAASFSMNSVFSDLDVIRFDQSAWVADYFNRKIFHIDVDGDVIEHIELSGYPVAIEVDEQRNRVWISQTDPGSLVRYTGGLLDRIFDLEAYPLSLALDNESGDLWGCSSGSGTVMKVNNEEIETAAGFDAPEEIAFDHVRRNAWVATRTRVIKLDSDMNIILSVDGYNKPEGLAVDTQRGNIWIADTRNSRVVKISQDGDFLAGVTGLTEPYSVAVDEAREECWIADSYKGEVIRVSAYGRYLKVKDGFLSPFGICIIP